MELRLIETRPADHQLGQPPVYRFLMIRSETAQELGGINFRVGQGPNIELFRGNLGFTVHPEHRGHHYAARSCRLLGSVIRHHNQAPVWLTCTDGNVASQKTIEALGARFLEVRDIPTDWPYLDDYPPGERRKRRYRWDP